MNKNGPSDWEPSYVTLSRKGYTEAIGATKGRGVFWTTDIRAELPIRIPETGFSSEVQPMTFP
jgi:hypothetical protein